MRGKFKKESKDMPTTPAVHKSTVEKLEAEIKAYYSAKLKEEEAAKRKGVEVLTTGDFDQQKFERALSASSLRAGQSRLAQGSSPAAQITRERWPHITPSSFSTVENPGSLQKKATRAKLRERLEEYKEMFELNFQKAFNFKPLDAIYGVRQEFNDPLNTLTICGFSINSKGKIIDYNLSSGSIAQEHSNDCRRFNLIKAHST
jgi:esterase/lipase superfamily enzyme